MATKIRLQRFGKKGKPFYHVVVADSRSPRDGKFIERLGSYNPNTNPATIELNFDSTLSWMNKGAQPTDTCRAILSYKGVLYKKHLEGGVRKGALTQEQADARFAAWLEAKTAKIEGKKSSLSQSKAEIRKAALEAEKAKKEKIAAAVALKNTPPEDEVAEEAAPVEEPVAEAPAAVVEEAPANEAAPAVEEAPATEAPADETPEK
jgi:small subunit ribosomal protein S16